ncbi:hypothetical protein BCR33DRAFT_853578 [Rhizoclosmatium globosum]|uniref:Uncharacterized protein n=1 Tax=Rhizoclosmatium globosum TaxID=329046 RepID=A0A1Y2BWF6_9FUNG|nr:hypothetical protein BCR33DRAFT_853578 [Rhizoclosmatium globosum]|eukprot:ORY38994.1 hypothetical protein BCR33DRAFT_853578 [Rhizoclosmatium globosum]
MNIEPHFQGAEIVRDIVVGLSDGFTVLFALTAGLASLGDSRFPIRCACWNGQWSSRLGQLCPKQRQMLPGR